VADTEWQEHVQKQLSQLDVVLEALEGCFGTLRSVHTIDVEEASALMASASELAAEITERVRSVSPGAQVEWSSREGFTTAVSALGAKLKRVQSDTARLRLSGIADTLARGAVKHWREQQRVRWDRARLDAAAETSALATSDAPPDLPGPAQGPSWLEWALGLGDPGVQQNLAQLDTILPALMDFLCSVQIGGFCFPTLSTTEAVATPEAVPPSALTVENGPQADTVEAPLVSEPPPPSVPAEEVHPTGAEVAAELSQHPPNATSPATLSAEVLPSEASEQPADGEQKADQDSAHASLQQQEPSVSPLASATPPLPGGPAELPSQPATDPSGTVQVVRRVAPNLEHTVQSFSAFREQWWVNPEGHCELVPWAQPQEFGERLRDAQFEALGLPDFTRLLMFARATEKLDQSAILGSQDVESLSEAWHAPASLVAGVDESRSRRMADASTGAWSGSEEGLRLLLCMEATRPSSAFRLAPAQVDDVVAVAGFADNSLRLLTGALLKVAAQGAQPLDVLRDSLHARVQPTLSQLTETLDSARTQLKAHVVSVWSIGGKVQRTHCRDAWTKFMENQRDFWTRLYPVTAGGAKTWDPESVQADINRLTKRHAAIADREQALQKDRKTMDKEAEKLAELAGDVNEAMAALLKASDRRPAGPRNVIPGGAAEHLLASAPLAAPDEELGRRLILRLLDGKAEREASAFELTVADLMRSPELLEVMPAIDVNVLSGHDHGAAALVDVRKLVDTPRAGALLLVPTTRIPSSPAGVGSMVEQLRDHFQARGRTDLLSRLTAQHPPDDSLFPSQSRERLNEKVHEAVGRLGLAWRALDELASPLKDGVRRALDQAQDFASDDVRVLSESVLFLHWLDRVAAEAETTIQAAVEALRGRARPEQLEQVTHALADRRFADALLLVDGTAPTVSFLRETEYRSKAASRFSEPLGLLQVAGRTNKVVKALGDAWFKGVSGQPKGADRPLRRTFAEFVLPSGQHLTAGDTYYLIPTALMRDWFARNQLNPTFLPQLSRAASIVLLTPLVPPSHPTFVQKTADQVSQHSGSYPIVLAPKLTAEPRDALLKEFQRRGLLAAVFDDLDLCRLVNPGGRTPNGLLGTMEIFLEQQHHQWKTVSPFTTQEGQNVHMEMYVGRRGEAERLSKTPEFSRLFSGRKLGKTALLKFIETTYDGQPLPSGKTLRVLYVPIVGAENDHDVVDRVLAEMTTRLGYKPALGPITEPVKRLNVAMQRWLEMKKDESLLVVLDEADVFVEAQIAEYERPEVREKCLTFQMRSELEKYKDQNQFPRVRFVFSGYRTTHTNEGAWANWGDVLRLAPLSVDEGTRLVEGPLARLGIDAGHQAPVIAWRCGYQPAVLIRFGRQLLEHLDSSRARTQRHSIVVTEDDVSATFNHAAVQTEIRTVVWNNFHGNRVAKIVFAAMLIEIAELPPGEGLDDAAARILARLKKTDPDISWLQADEVTAQAEIARLLREFVERELLVDRGTRLRPLYTMRFPHHLPVLKPGEQDGVIRSELQAVRSVAGPDPFTGVKSLLSRHELESIRAALSDHTEPRTRACVVTSLWPAAIESTTGGIADRLGIPAHSVAKGSAVAEGRGALDEFVVVRGADAAIAERLLKWRPVTSRPPILLGGADLLRWVLQRQLVGEDFFETCSVGRAARPAVSWWFERVRGLEFSSPQSLERIISRTSCVPLLLRFLDELWADRTGATLDQHDVDQGLERLDEQLPGLASSLANGSADVRLEQRELEILKMSAVVARAQQGDVSLREALTEMWDLFYREKLDMAPVTEADALHVRVLLDLGLLPANPNVAPGQPLHRLGKLLADDALVRLVEAGGQS
jgi:hypothetical protein